MSVSLRSGVWARSLVVVSGILSACAVVEPPQVNKQHDIRFVGPSFHRELVGAGGVAILPILGGVGPEGIKDDAAFELAQAFRRAFPKSKVIPKDRLLRQLSSNQLDDVVKELVRGYERTAKMSPALLLRLQKDISVRYLVYGRLEKFSERQRDGTRHKEVQLYSEIWDLPCRVLVWSGTGSHRVKESLQQDETPTGDLFVGAARETVAAVGPSTGKKMTKQVIAC